MKLLRNIVEIVGWWFVAIWLMGSLNLLDVYVKVGAHP